MEETPALLSTSDIAKKELALRRRMEKIAVALWIAGGLELAILPWVLGVWSLINAGLLLVFAGLGFWFYASIRYHGRSIDEAYRLGYDLGYEIGWRAQEFEHNASDERPLAPRKPANG